MNIRRIPKRRLLALLRDTEEVSGRDSDSAKFLRRELDRRKASKGRKEVTRGQ